MNWGFAVMSNLENTEKGLSFLDKALGMVEKYKMVTVFKAIFIILLIAGTIAFINHPTYIFEKYQAWQDEQHSKAMEYTLINNEKLHILSEKLLYRVEAKRVMVLSLHNGNESNGGLPFAKCTATYEALSDNAYPIAPQYQDIQLSLMPFATKLFQVGYWCGDVEDLKEIDKSLYYKMKGNDTEHFAACVIEGVDKPLAFLFVSFNTTDDNHNCSDVRENIRHIALEMALLLELNKQL